MSRAYRLYLKDILVSIQRIKRYTQDMSEKHFESDQVCQDAVLFNLYLIGEAVKQIPQETREKYHSH